jgi:hypothetical protein
MSMKRIPIAIRISVGDLHSLNVSPDSITENTGIFNFNEVKEGT